jgi:hypothetical protein
MKQQNKQEQRARSLRMAYFKFVLFFCPLLVAGFYLWINSSIKLPHATILEYGIMEDIEPAKRVSTPFTASGFMKVSSNVRFVKETDQIPKTIGSRFGLRYSISGLPSQPGSDVSVALIHPTIQKREGTTTTGYEVQVGTQPVNGTIMNYSGYSLDHDYELVSGEWTFEVRYKNQKLVSKTFHVE